MVNKQELKLFLHTNILSDIAQKGYYVFINGPQLLLEINNDGSRVYSGYTNATPEEIEDIFISKYEYNIFKENSTIKISEALKTEDTAYTFILHSLKSKDEDTAESFCLNLLQSQTFGIDQVGYEASIGIVDYADNWRNFFHGTITLPRNFSDIIQSDPSKLVSLLTTLTSNNYLNLSNDAISVIQDNAASIRYATPESLRIMMNNIIKNNPQKLEMLKNLKILEHLIPEFCASFEDRNNFPDFIYPTSGDGCIAILSGLSEISVWALIFHFSGKAVSEPHDFGGYQVAINFTENSMIIANKVLSFLEYPEPYIIKVLSLLYLLNDFLPDDYWGAITYIVDKFEDYQFYTNFIETRYNLSQMYSSVYKNKEMNKLTFLAEIAENYEESWDRASINISDKALKILVGEDKYEEALKSIKLYLFRKPFNNTIFDIIEGLEESGQFTINYDYFKSLELEYEQSQVSNDMEAFNHNDEIDETTKALSEKRILILKQLNSYDYDKIEYILYDKENEKTEEELTYARGYLYLKSELGEINDELLARDALSPEDKAIVLQSKEINEVYKKELDKINFINSMFTENDTEFFEYIYQLVPMIIDIE